MSKFISTVLIIVSAGLTAKIAWSIISPIKNALSEQPAFSSSSHSHKENISPILPSRSIVTKDLFGKLERASARPTLSKLTKPTNNISLLGVVSEPEGRGYAFINYNGKLGVIAQGDSLASLENESLALTVVRSDGIELERLETNETLHLSAPTTELRGISRKVVASLEQESPIISATISPNSQEKENKLLPAKNSDFSGTVFNLKPFQIKGNKQVFIITSGTDRQRLQRLNIHPGDIVTHINQDSADKYSLTEALELLKQNEPVTLKLKRGVETLEFTLEATS